MANAEIVELLRKLSNPDNKVREQAEQMYQQAKQGSPDQLMPGMLSVLGAKEVDTSVRSHCAVLLRQFMARGTERNFVWARLAPNIQQQVAAELLRQFEAEPLPQMLKRIGEIVSKLAEHVCDENDPRGSLAPGTPTAWPALLPTLFRLANASTATSADNCEASIRLLKDLVPTMKSTIATAQQEMQQVIQQGLTHANLKLKVAAFLFVCSIVSETGQNAWAPLAQTMGALVQVLQQLAQQKDEQALQEAIQSFIEVASWEPDFFKATLSQSLEPAKTLASIAACRDIAENGLRGLALEWLVSFLEKRAKWLTQSLPTFAPVALETALKLMLELEDGETELKEWAGKLADEEGDEDDELYWAGEQAVDRIVCAIGMEALGPQLFPLIGSYMTMAHWQARHAALAAMKQSVEYVEESSHVDEMAKNYLQQMEHQHPRVRYMALYALGQTGHDQQPHFQEQWHRTVMPVLMKLMDDSVDRVASMAMSAFVSFGEPLDTTLMASYAGGFMEKVVQKMKTTQHRGVREESITCIAVIAGVIGKDFSTYYDAIMPLLKQFVQHCKGEKEGKLRGKSFECMSLLGVAIGKEKFLPDAKEAMQAMMSKELQNDEILLEYIKQASERICVCLGKDFAPFLPAVLPDLLAGLALTEDAGGNDAEDQYYQVCRGDGQMVKVHTSRFEAMKDSLRLLNKYCDVCEGSFFDHVPATARAMLPLLSTTNDWQEDVRGDALWTWSLLVKSARAGCTERNLPPNHAHELLLTGIQHAFKSIDSATDAASLASTANPLAECIKNVGTGVLSAQEIQQLAGKAFQMLDQSFERTAKLVAMRQKAGKAAVDEDDDQNGDLQQEEACRQAYVEMLTSMMKVAPAEFLQCVPECGQRIQQWIATTENKALALYLAGALIEHLKERSESVWPVFMPQLFQSLGDTNAEVRTNAAWAINTAAPIPGFAQAAPEAFRRLAQIVSAARPKKRDEKAKTAYDNAVGALLSMAIVHQKQCPPEIQTWNLILARLPLRDDEEEAKIVHEKLVDQVMAQNADLLGPQNGNLAPVLSILAEVYKTESICNKSSDEKILKVFKMIPPANLSTLASGFTEKQQKKIQKMLSS
eukprot:TRINITY_DN24680_c0_g3_i1.p1 TRINITY_DN24680_c0_g3~~TRINITY_DN24680_c0_g3_i1.p1  ORF type:complete len:1101 (-),score=285.62 TRINITY_DN24680_c0_g3_i1:18-3320(-)